MLLGDLDTAVTEQRRNALHRYAGLEQPDCEGVPKAVRVAVWNPRLLEYPPFSVRCQSPVGCQLRLACPNEIPPARPRSPPFRLLCLLARSPGSPARREGRALDALPERLLCRPGSGTSGVRLLQIGVVGSAPFLRRRINSFGAARAFSRLASHDARRRGITTKDRFPF